MQDNTTVHDCQLRQLSRIMTERAKSQSIASSKPFISSFIFLLIIFSFKISKPSKDSIKISTIQMIPTFFSKKKAVPANSYHPHSKHWYNAILKSTKRRTKDQRTRRVRLWKQHRKTVLLPLLLLRRRRLRWLKSRLLLLTRQQLRTTAATTRRWTHPLILSLTNLHPSTYQFNPMHQTVQSHQPHTTPAPTSLLIASTWQEEQNTPARACNSYTMPTMTIPTTRRPRRKTRNARNARKSDDYAL